MVIYACDVDDAYPFPTRALRKSIYKRVSGFYKTMSYGKHRISFKEATDDGGFFVSDHAAGYYKKNYDRQRHVRGFAMFNEEILEKVRARYGDKYFRDVDMIVVVGQMPAGTGTRATSTPRASACWAWISPPAARRLASGRGRVASRWRLAQISEHRTRTTTGTSI